MYAIRSYYAFETIEDPTHPHADANGLVRFPNVNTVVEMADLITAMRDSILLCASISRRVSAGPLGCNCPSVARVSAKVSTRSVNAPAYCGAGPVGCLRVAVAPIRTSLFRSLTRRFTGTY